MKRKEFRDLLRRYLNDDCSVDERRLVDQLYDLIGEETPVSWDDEEEVEAKMWAKIEAQTIGNNNPNVSLVAPERINRKLFSRPVWRMAAAAVLVGFVATVGFFMLKNKGISSVLNKETMVVSWKEIINHNVDPMSVTMEDGSKIILKSESRLRFPAPFGADKREVFLTGDAFFDIAKNPNRPFFVHAKNVVTRVLGTSFWVKNTEGVKGVSVEVVTGKVTVYKEKATVQKPSQSDGVVLTPNLKVTYFIEDEHFVTGIVAKPLLLKKLEPTAEMVQFSFNDTPLSEVMRQLEVAYGIQFVLANDALSNCPLTANLTQQPLFTKLELICATLNAAYEVKGTSILISGKGCE